MRVSCLFVALFAAGCAAPAGNPTTTVRDAWLGAGYDEVVARWGVPARSTKLSEGRDAHTWVSESARRRGSLWPSIGVGIGSGGVGIGTGVTVAPGTEAVRCERTLIFKDARVVSQSWAGGDDYCNEFVR